MEYQKLFREAAQIVSNYYALGSLQILDENGKFDDKIDGELSAAKKFYDPGFEHYIEFRTKISPQVLELTERVKNSKMISLKDEEIRAAFDEAVDSAKVELDVTAMKLNYKTEEYIPQFEKLLKLVKAGDA